MRYVLLSLAIIGLAGCVSTTTSPTPASTSTTYVAPVPPTSSTTIIRQ
jgi:hypothetical protein